MAMVQRKIAKFVHLETHMANAKVASCDGCNRIFCHEITYQQHKLREQLGGTINGNSYILDTPIFPDIGHTYLP